MVNFSNSRSRSRKGQGLAEYAMIIALLSIVMIAALTPIGEAVNKLFGTHQAKVDVAKDRIVATP